jgi:hypothetical protein
MDLATMRTKFKRHTSGTTDHWTEAEVDSFLNYIYAEFLPADIDGKVHEVTWISELSIGVNPLVIPNHIVAFPKGQFFIQGTSGNAYGSVTPLTYFDTLLKFLGSFPDHRDPSNTGRPSAVFRSGKKLWFDVFPDSNYNLVADARGCQEPALSAAGLPFNHAMAVVIGAAWNYLMEQEDEVAVQKMAIMYETFKGRLILESSFDYTTRTPHRSF